MRHYLYIVLLILSSCLSETKNKFEYDQLPLTKAELAGNWVLDSTNLPFSFQARIPSFCNDLYPGSRFTFTKDSTLKIIAKDSTKECFEYTYNIHGDELTITEWDMVMTFQIDSLTTNTLTIRSPYMPDMTISREQGYLLFLSKGDSK